MFKQEFLDFLKSNEAVFNIDEKQNLIKIPHNDFNIIYYIKSSALYSTNLELLFCADNKGEILFIDNYNFGRYCNTLLDGTEDITHFKVPISNVTNLIKEKAMEYFEKNKDTFELLDNENIRNSASEFFIKKTSPVFNKDSIYFDVNINFDTIEKFYFDKENFINECAKECIEKYKNAYIKHLSTLKAFNELNENINKTDAGKFKSSLIDVLGNKAHKTLKITYEDMRGNIHHTIFHSNQNSYNFSRIRTEILNKNILSDTEDSSIPIYSIKKIDWSRSNLFDAKDYELDISEKSLLENFLECYKIDCIPDKFFENKELFLSVYLFNQSQAFEKLSDDLSKDEDFLIELLKNNNTYLKNFIHAFAPKNLITNKVISAMSERADFTKYAIYDLVLNMDSIDDIDVFEKLLKNANGYYTDNIIAITSANVFANEKVKEILEKYNYSLPNNCDFYKKIPVTTIFKIFPMKRLVGAINYLDPVSFNTQDIIDLLDSRDLSVATCFRKNNFPSIAETFEFDEEFIKALGRNICTANELNYFKNLTHINCDTINDDILTFMNENIYFVGKSASAPRNYYIDCCTSDIKEITDFDSRAISFKCENYEFVIYKNGSLEISNNKDYFTFSDSSLFNSVIENLSNFVKENYKVEAKDFDSIKTFLENKDIEDISR